MTSCDNNSNLVDENPTRNDNTSYLDEHPRSSLNTFSPYKSMSEDYPDIMSDVYPDTPSMSDVYPDKVLEVYPNTINSNAINSNTINSNFYFNNTNFSETLRISVNKNTAAKNLQQFLANDKAFEAIKEIDDFSLKNKTQIENWINALASCIKSYQAQDWYNNQWVSLVKLKLGKKSVTLLAIISSEERNGKTFESFANRLLNIATPGSDTTTHFFSKLLANLQQPHAPFSTVDHSQTYFLAVTEKAKE
jgi:hypothetical protein